MFNKLKVASAKEDKGSPYKFLLCCSILKDHLKFDGLLHPQSGNNRRSSEEHGEEEENHVSATEQCKRPIGRKRRKAHNHKNEMELNRLKISKAALAA